jgi:hypothetical protein
MGHFPWTKFQDFYLRLGFLKVLVASLSPQRRSTLNDAIVRRLESPLFDAAASHEDLWERVESRIDWYPRKTASGKTIECPEAAEALLVDGMTASFLYGITRDTTYKILDWGHTMQFVGRGNQITERGLLLRQLLPAESIDDFFAGKLLQWNPFVLNEMEKLFFLYHLIEIDAVTLEIIESLGELESDTILESNDSAQITCRAIFKVLDETKDMIDPREAPAYRTASELACAIAAELGLEDLEAKCKDTVRRRAPKPVKPSARRSAFITGKERGAARKTTKNADHQTIPRFEQLVDLGFLTKPRLSGGQDQSSELAVRRRWRYAPTAACRGWRAGKPTQRGKKEPFQWCGFAKTAVAAFHTDALQDKSSRQVDRLVTAKYLWNAYEKVRRPIGHTPLDSVALVAMITAATDGIALEMTDFHQLMISIKNRSLLPEHVFFASGNDLDKMFIQIKPGFVEQFRTLDGGRDEGGVE